MALLEKSRDADYCGRRDYSHILKTKAWGMVGVHVLWLMSMYVRIPRGCLCACPSRADRPTNGCNAQDRLWARVQTWN
ncbi:hypothetical protein COCC4DRAFT_145285 [Bipolaris maydis ATCC 48331]|uniref:Uncharacterized protein n=2 Tax=Cochliobolus heterostrophus TaxID=5016 RepID=M2T2T1_COCH5|nr:uncharacterized protein COCC4DRAFT_145285 [Bipolaris maydis ATCC 48331]EMD91870.1 hypothetical protein COCHEDRAFT_1154892 [Bipolaris maydis C5]ENI02646.1 hypothetical protein COCC4DRAFT_145285 [Bipolaris maydis ATCC 48331]